MKRRRLSKSEVKELNEQFPLELAKKDAVDLLDDTFYIVNGTPSLFEQEGKLVPHLRLLQERDLLKKVTVDMGAVPFLMKSADVMRPGITEIDESITKGELIAVVDETHGKALAVGEALMDSAEMRAAKSGKAIKTLHYIGDRWWNRTLLNH